MTEDEKKEKREKENRDQLLIALAVLLYKDAEKKISTVEDIPNDIRSKLEKKIDDFLAKGGKDINDIKDIKELNALTKAEILKIANDISGTKSDYLKVVTVGDDRTCDRCKKWEGKIISDLDEQYPSFSDFEKSGAAHFGCRCFLKPININTSANSSEDDYVAVFSGFYSTIKI